MSNAYRLVPIVELRQISDDDWQRLATRPAVRFWGRQPLTLQDAVDKVNRTVETIGRSCDEKLITRDDVVRLTRHICR